MTRTTATTSGLIAQHNPCLNVGDDLKDEHRASLSSDFNFGAPSSALRHSQRQREAVAISGGTKQARDPRLIVS